MWAASVDTTLVALLCDDIAFRDLQFLLTQCTLLDMITQEMCSHAKEQIACTVRQQEDLEHEKQAGDVKHHQFFPPNVMRGGCSKIVQGLPYGPTKDNNPNLGAQLPGADLEAD